MMNKKQKERFEREQLKGASLISVVQPNAQVSEQLRSIRTNISYSMVDGTLKTLMFTSTGPYEGKSTIAMNVAAMFASEGRRVLIVDGDMRKPTVHRTFGIQNSKGLTTLLRDKQIQLEDCIQFVQWANVFVLTSGPKPPNPAELLSSKRMERIVEELKQQFDLVIFDMPPILTVTDAQIMATKIDGVVFVIRKGIAEKRGLKRAKELLDAADAHVIGAVFNGVEQSNATYYSDYYQRYEE